MSATDDGPMVSVFHFTSRISSAKIRKYTHATEKGMGSGNGRTPTPGPSNTKSTPSPALGPSAMDPPAKKRLKLNVNRFKSQDDESESLDTIALARPQRAASSRKRKSEEMEIEEIAVDPPKVNGPPASPAASSDLSSLSSIQPLEDEQTTVNEPAEELVKTRGYSMDFMSFYVDGGDDGDDDVEEIKPRAPLNVSIPTPSRNNVDAYKAATATAPAAPAPAPAVVKQPPPAGVRPTLRHQAPQPPRETQFRNHTGPPPPYPTSARERPLPKPLPLNPPYPIVHLTDSSRRPPASKQPDTVRSMVRKLQVLSEALSGYNGASGPQRLPSLEPPARSSVAVPSIPAQPITAGPSTAPNNPQSRSTGEPAGSGAAVDGLLAMFGDDDDEDEAEGTSRQPPLAPAPRVMPNPLDEPLKHPGEYDDALSYGIKFIQNALRSWAHQRLSQEYAHFYFESHARLREEAQRQKRGPGRPRKYDDNEDFRNPPPPQVSIDLAKTKEGATIAAFQDVLDSGCLQVNVLLPMDLARALRHLYWQIDQLINQGGMRPEPPWRCMSYGAQIAAHKAQVDAWKEAQDRAQAEMEHRYHIAEQQNNVQTGMPSTRTPMTKEQFHHAHAVDLERSRNVRQASKQPHLSQYINHPMEFVGQAAAVNVTTSATHPSPLPVSTTTASSSTVSRPMSNGGLVMHHAMPAPQRPGSSHSVQLDRSNALMSNLLSRSGQSMKFSFPPKNDLAVTAFGSQAFPTHDNNASVPNRGPMSGGYTRQPIPNTKPQRLSNGKAPPPVKSASHTAPKTTSLASTPSDTIRVASRPSSQQGAQASPTAAKPSSSITNGIAAVKSDASPQTKMNASGVSASSTIKPTDAPVRTPSIDLTNGAHRIPPSSSTAFTAINHQIPFANIGEAENHMAGTKSSSFAQAAATAADQ